MEIVTKIAPLVLAIIMLGLGLGLSIKDFTRILKYPKDFFVGFICQLILLPIVAFCVAISLNLPTPIAIGLMIIAAAPGGVTSNVLTKFANGDVALSITLTAVVSLHQVDLAKKFANRLLGISGGKIIFDGKAEDLTFEILRDLYGENYRDHSEPQVVNENLM